MAGGGPGVGRVEKVQKSIFAISFRFEPTSPTDSCATSYGAYRSLTHPLTLLNHSRALHIHDLPCVRWRARWGLSKNFEKSQKKLKFSKFATSSNFDATSPAGFLGKSYASSGPLTRPVNTLHLARALPLRGLGEFESYVAEKQHHSLEEKKN